MLLKILTEFNKQKKQISSEFENNPYNCLGDTENQKKYIPIYQIGLFKMIIKLYQLKECQN